MNILTVIRMFTELLFKRCKKIVPFDDNHQYGIGARRPAERWI